MRGGDHDEDRKTRRDGGARRAMGKAQCKGNGLLADAKAAGGKRTGAVPWIELANDIAAIGLKAESVAKAKAAGMGRAGLARARRQGDDDEEIRVGRPADCRGRHAKGRRPYPALSTSVLTTGWPSSTQACHPPFRTATCVYPCSWRNRATRALVASSRQVQYATASRSRGTSP